MILRTHSCVASRSWRLSLGGFMAALVMATANGGCTDVGDSSALPGNAGTGESDDMSPAVGAVGALDAATGYSGQDATGAQNEAAAAASTNPAMSAEPDGSPKAPREDATVEEMATPDTGAHAAGLQDAGGEHATGDSAISDGALESTPSDGTIDVRAAPSPDSAASEGAPETGTTEASASETGPSGATEAGSLVPCTSAGQTNCVSCPNRSSGVCTETEAAFVALDIGAGAVTVSGPDYTGSPSSTGSCFSCLVASSCVDNPQHGIKNRECDDIGTATFSQTTATFTNGSGASVGSVSACIGALLCVLGPTGQQCAANAQGETFCYCGTGGFAGLGPTTCSSNGASVNGPCLAAEVAGFTFAQSDANDIINNYTDTTGANPSGIANQILDCAQGNECTTCLQ